MSEDNKSEFGESTVVHAFDANTVVHVKPIPVKKPAAVQPKAAVQAKVAVEPQIAVEIKEGRAEAKAKVAAANKLRVRLVVASIFCALTLTVLLMRREAPKTQVFQPTAADANATELASEAAPIAKSKFLETVDSNEVLTKFDKAFGAAQQRASESAR